MFSFPAVFSFPTTESGRSCIDSKTLAEWRRDEGQLEAVFDWGGTGCVGQPLEICFEPASQHFQTKSLAGVARFMNWSE